MEIGPEIISAVILPFLPAWMAYLDACPTGDQEVTDLTPAGLAAFFCVENNHYENMPIQIY